jgi:hypothetical protein
MKRKIDLSAPIDRGDGIHQSKVELDYVYIHDDSFSVYTKQGNVVIFKMNPARQAFVDMLEDAVKNRLERNTIEEED